MSSDTATTDLVDQNGSIVAIGSFNPAIFHPEWLVSNEVIGRAEADECLKSGFEVTHSEIAILELNQMRLEVSLDRFVLITKEAPLIRGADFAAKVFLILVHSPIRELGLNITSQFKARRREDWDALGDALSPKAPWERLGKNDIGKRTVGLRSMTVERAPRPDGIPGYERVIVAAANDDTMTTQVTLNSHFKLERETAAEAADLILNHWVASEHRAADITASLRGLTRAI